MADAPSLLELSLKRDRAIVLLGLVSIAALAWIYTAYLAWDMRGMHAAMELAMPQMQVWGGLELTLLFFMWVIMMIAMMLPSATPMMLMYTSTLRRREPERGVLPQTGMFVSGYVTAWAGFSILATLAQWGLHAAALLSAMMVSSSAILGGVLLIMAGLFQWAPLKHACLRRCRSPLGFLMTEWREGRRGAFIMGLRHGLFCVGCCWALMALLFVTGVMNLLWIAVIAVFVLIEKIAPAGEWLARGAGLVMIGYGSLMIFGTIAIR